MKKLKAAVNVNIAMLSHCKTDRRLPCCLHFTVTNSHFANNWKIHIYSACTLTRLLNKLIALYRLTFDNSK